MKTTDLIYILINFLFLLALAAGQDLLKEREKSDSKYIVVAVETSGMLWLPWLVVRKDKIGTK